MFRLLCYFVAPVVLLGATLAVAARLLPACAAIPILGGLFAHNCPTAGWLRADDALRAERARGAALERQIAMLETDLIDRGDCPLPATEPQPAELAPDIMDRDRWEGRDITMMEGCWELDSNLRTENEATGEINTVADWLVCFNASGSGQQRLTFDDGQICEDALAAKFTEGGRLRMKESRNLRCSGGRSIYRREITCSLDSNNRAQCLSSHPDQGLIGAHTRLRRAEGRRL